MRYFKFPLIVTGIAFALMLVLGVIGLVVVDRSSRNEQEKIARGKLLGQGLGTLTCLVVAPFWILAAAKMGKDRRAANSEKTVPSAKKSRKKKEIE